MRVYLNKKEFEAIESAICIIETAAESADEDDFYKETLGALSSIINKYER